MLELKDYQTKVIEYLDAYIEILNEKKQEKLDYYEFLLSKGKKEIAPEYSDYCNLAWETIKSRKEVFSPDYKNRNDGMGRKIPNICFKVPTGGGKTLLAASALMRINQDYLKRNNGFVLWIVPSEPIYTQTSKQLRNREHPYRQILDMASGGRTKILEKGDSFNKQDVEGNLCVMLLMLQSSNRQNKDTLKIFKDSGQFESFFPPIDDYNANIELWDSIKNLETFDIFEKPNVVDGLLIKHSLGNVMRILRPIILFDEGHRGATKLAQDTVNSLNPAFILELSATPKENSNVLINISGQELKKEQMIKLPINVHSYEQNNWQHTLNNAHKKLLEISSDAIEYQAQSGKYIRPIMVIKAEPNKKTDAFNHVEEIQSYLIKNLNANEEEIRIKLADKDELQNDDLFDKLCPVKYIITKDALKEGWDCSFAYILTILANAKSETALTQFIGRILRQPNAQTTSVQSLNQCYVYCNSSDVSDAVEGIKKGLEQDGLADISSDVVSSDGNNQIIVKTKTKRNPKYQNEKIFIPLLNIIRDGIPQKFNYYSDIAAGISWDNYSFEKCDAIHLNQSENIQSKTIKIDVADNEQHSFSFSQPTSESQHFDTAININLMVSQLMDKVPNAWQAYRIIDEVIKNIKEKGIGENIIAHNSVLIVEEIKKDAFSWYLKQSELLFKSKLNDGTIFLKLLAEPCFNLNWEMSEEIEILHNKSESTINLDKNIFQPQYPSNYNGMEKDIALAINSKEAVKWWHRLAVKGTEYNIQGWKRERIYPDFLITLKTGKIYFIETKGLHLKGNDDTAYKQELFRTINDVIDNKITPNGEFELITKDEDLNFDMIFENEWDNELNRLLK